MKILKTLVIFVCYSTSFAQFSASPEGIELPKVATLPDCNSSSIGKVTYLTTTNKAYLCNGTTWNEISEFALPLTSSINSNTVLLDIQNTGNGIGIFGKSFNNTAIYGESTNSLGVRGLSTSNYGGYFTGKRGVYASGSDWALYLTGKLNLQNSTGTKGNTIVIDGFGEPTWQPSVAFAVKDVGASGQTISHNLDIKVNFDTEEYDLGNDFDLSTNTFIVPYTGLYHFDAAVMWDGPSNSTGFLAITLRVGNSNIFTVRSPASQNQSPSNMLSTDISLTAGQQVYILAYQSTGANQNINSDSRTSRFSGRLVTKL